MKAVPVNESEGGYQHLTGFDRVKGNHNLGGNSWDYVLGELMDKIGGKGTSNGCGIFIGIVLGNVSSEFVRTFNSIFNGGAGVTHHSSVRNLIYKGSDSEKFNKDVHSLSKNIAGAYLLTGIALISGHQFLVTDGRTITNTFKQGAYSEITGNTNLSDDGSNAMVTYNPDITGFKADGVTFNGMIALGHELFHGLDLLTAKHNLPNLIMSHDYNHESLNTTYQAESVSLFGVGNEGRLYFESRAVTFENLIRIMEPNTNNSKAEIRKSYAPFSDVVKFTSWISSHATNMINNFNINFKN